VALSIALFPCIKFLIASSWLGFTGNLRIMRNSQTLR
jgi:hypothetical protein